jgi:hypothetical protein
MCSFAIEETEMLKDSAVRRRHGVMCLINDNQEELFWAKLAEPGACRSTKRWD